MDFSNNNRHNSNHDHDEESGMVISQGNVEEESLSSSFVSSKQQNYDDMLEDDSHNTSTVESSSKSDEIYNYIQYNNDEEGDDSSSSSSSDDEEPTIYDDDDFSKILIVDENGNQVYDNFENDNNNSVKDEKNSTTNYYNGGGSIARNSTQENSSSISKGRNNNEEKSMSSISSSMSKKKRHHNTVVVVNTTTNADNSSNDPSSTSKFDVDTENNEDDKSYDDDENFSKCLVVDETGNQVNDDDDNTYEKNSNNKSSSSGSRSTSSNSSKGQQKEQNNSNHAAAITATSANGTNNNDKTSQSQQQQEEKKRSTLVWVGWTLIIISVIGIIVGITVFFVLNNSGNSKANGNNVDTVVPFDPSSTTDDDTETTPTATAITDQPSNVPSVSPTNIPTTGAPTTNNFDLISSLIYADDDDDTAVPTDSSSPQWKALHWLAEVDNYYNPISVTDITNENKNRALRNALKQRYALATIYFSTTTRTTTSTSQDDDNHVWKDELNFMNPNEHECNWNVVVDTSTNKDDDEEEAGSNEDGSIVVTINNPKTPAPTPVDCSLVECVRKGYICYDNKGNALLSSSSDGGTYNNNNATAGGIDNLFSITSTSFNESLVYSTSLILSNNSLVGMIPEYEINLLLEEGSNSNRRLKQLHLDHNDLYSYIPTIVGTSISENNKKGFNHPLKELFLHGNNHLIGTIPFLPSLLLIYPNLQSLKLNNNRLTGPINMPTVIGGSNKILKELDLSSNVLTGSIPQSINSYFNGIERLDLSNNTLEGEVTIFSSESNNYKLSTHLQYIDLSNNRGLFGTLQSTTISKMKKLQHIGLSNNRFTDDIPTALFQNLTNIITILFDNNQFTGSITKLFSNGNISSSTNTTNANTVVTTSSNLQYVDLSNNKIGASIPDISQHYSSLIGLKLSYNDLSGTIPEGFATKCSNLETLALDHNSLVGSVPNTIHNMSSLKALLIHNNQLTNTIPESINELQYLEVLDMSFNRLEGKIPFEEDSLVSNSLREIALINNVNLTGSIRPLTYLQKLEVIYSYGTNFTGKIPNSICSLSNLWFLDLSGNSLTSSIPSCFFDDLLYLRRLTLDENSLTGQIPWYSTTTNYLSLGYMEKFSLSKNKFSGSLPTNIGSDIFSFSLQYFDIGNNDFTGTIPPTFGMLSNLQQLKLENNNFSGTLPRTFQNLNKLDLFFIHNNDMVDDVSFMCNSNGEEFVINNEIIPPYSHTIKHFGSDCGDFGQTSYNVEVNCTCCKICCNVNQSCYQQVNIG